MKFKYTKTAFVVIGFLLLIAASYSYAASGSISVSTPNCSTGQNCSAVVTWSTSGTNSVIVRVTSDPGLNGITNDFSADLNCSAASCGATGDWLVPGHTYVFNLYDTEANSLLDSARVVVESRTESNLPSSSTSTFPTSPSTTNNVPLNSSGGLNPGWSSMGGGWYYNSTLGLYSNADGSIQDTTSNGFGDKMQAASIAKVGISPTNYLMSGSLCVYNPYDNSFQPLNSAQFATLETANRMASIFGGTVVPVAIGPFYYVNICSFPAGQTSLKPENIVPQYEIRVGKYLGNAGLMAATFIRYPYDQAKAMIMEEINRENGVGSGGSATTPLPGSGTSGTTSSLGTPTVQSRQQIQAANDAAVQLRLQQLNQSGSSYSGTAGGAGTLTEAAKEAIRQQIQLLLQKVQELQAKLNAISGSDTSPITNTTTTIVTSSSTAISKGPWTFRYLKINTTEQGWVSWREIELYDAAGQKIALTKDNVSASCTWCGYGPTYDNPNPTVSSAPDKAIDGNSATSWNAGETADNCSWSVPHMRNDGIYGVGCSPYTSRSAWFLVDLGSLKTVSKIRLQENGDTLSETNDLLISTDGTTYSLIGKLKAPFLDGQWIQYPYTTYDSAPTVNLAVATSTTGVSGKDITVRLYTGYLGDESTTTITGDRRIIFTWDSKFVDYFTYSVTKTADSSLGSYDASKDLNCIWPHRNSPNPFFNRTTPIKFNESVWVELSPCMIGNVFTLNLIGHQWGSDRTTTATVTVRVKSPSLSLIRDELATYA